MRSFPVAASSSCYSRSFASLQISLLFIKSRKVLILPGQSKNANAMLFVLAPTLSWRETVLFYRHPDPVVRLPILGSSCSNQEKVVNNCSGQSAAPQNTIIGLSCHGRSFAEVLVYFFCRYDSNPFASLRYAQTVTVAGQRGCGCIHAD